jgi:signal transduction histidine kinase
MCPEGRLTEAGARAVESPQMIRRISTKWVLAVVAAVVIPFTAFAVLVEAKVTAQSEDVVRFHLLSTAADLASRIEEDLADRSKQVEFLAGIAQINWFLADRDGDRGIFEDDVEGLFDRLTQHFGVHQYVLVVDREGQVVAANRAGFDSVPLDPVVRHDVLATNLAGKAWLDQALETGAATAGPGTLQSLLGVVGDDGHYFALAARVPNQGEQTDPELGVVLALMSLDHVQALISTYGVRRLAEDGRATGEEDIYTSSYAWIWGADANTILAHKTPSLLGQKVTDLEGGQLQFMVDAARTAEWGMYPDYEFRGVAKKAAFRRMTAVEDGGVGWTVGVGVNKPDINTPVRELSHFLVVATALGVLIAATVAGFVARRTTRPIQELEKHTRRIASGDLDAHIVLNRGDELGDLARSFNTMTDELKTSRGQLVQAEKEAAWREMARQVAHEIKNPLTPITLSAGLLRRAREENHEDFDSILMRTIGMIERQTDAMRDIARDFSAFAGEHREPQKTDVGAIVDEVTGLSAAWAVDVGVEVLRVGDGGHVWADPGELQRAVLNLISNAIEAMPDGGHLVARVRSEGDFVHVEIEDEGVGLAPDVEARLFEPYFTTRTSGTGLGLAIVRRVVEDLGGTVSLDNRPGGRGTIARIRLNKYDPNSA